MIAFDATKLLMKLHFDQSKPTGERKQSQGLSNKGNLSATVKISFNAWMNSTNPYLLIGI